MLLFHVLTGVGLLGLAVYALVSSLREGSSSPDHWRVLVLFTGLLMAVILLTGFLQLGSRHSVHRFIIYKLGATILGGCFVVIALVGRIKKIIPRGLTHLAFVLAVFLFGFSLYLGIVI